MRGVAFAVGAVVVEAFAVGGFLGVVLAAAILLTAPQPGAPCPAPVDLPLRADLTPIELSNWSDPL